MKRKILYIAPHLSTGGMPQYLYKEMELLRDEFEIYCVEWTNVTGGVLVVQRNKIENLLGNRLITLGERKEEVTDVIKRINPDVIHLQEIPELFIEHRIAEKIYTKDRRYSIIETSHDSSQSAKTKRFFPDKFLFVSQYQVKQYQELGIPSDVVEYPIESFQRTKTREEAQRELRMDPTKKHVINVGLFTPRKNQAEIVEYARALKDHPVQFHFIGNQADNFRYYWEPLMQDWPENCKWWNERTDVETFYQAADLFLFTSRGSENDKETMPLVIREAISWQVPSLIYNLPVYENYFDKYENISYLGFNSLHNNSSKILEKLNLKKFETFFTMNGEEDLKSLTYPNSTWDTLQKYGDGAAQYFATYILKELEPDNFKIEKDTIFVDLGANIGMSSRYAKEAGVKEIICFEPDPNLIQIIQKNVPEAKIYRNAIGSKPNNIELYHWPFNPVNEGPKYRVDAITLKDVLKIVGKEIDYLKIDIEGFENDIFDDLTNEECSKIKKMFIEHHIPNQIESFISKLKSKGFDLFFHQGAGQSYIYAEYKNTINNMKDTEYKIHSRWDLNEQKIHFSTETDLNFPIIVSIKEYQSNTVIWAEKYDMLPAGIDFWIIPVHKVINNFSADELFTGIKLCIYKDDDYEKQIYEFPYFYKFVDKPTISMSNFIPYCVNYNEFFVQHKYDKFLKKGFDCVIDIGANVGIFSKYLLENKLAKKIIAIECDSLALKDLKRNFDTNDRVEIIDRAFHYSDEPITFYQSKDNPVISSTLSPDKLTHHMAGIKGDIAYIVNTITIKEIIHKVGTIDLLKIDIEGAEYDIIENLNIDLCKNINHIFVECHFFEKDYREKYEKLKNKLIMAGYAIEEYKENQIEMVGSSESIFASKIVK